MEVNGRRGCDNRRKKISLKSLLIPGSSSSGLNVFFQPVSFESILCAKCCITQWEYRAWDSRTAVAKLLLKLLEFSSALGSRIQALFWAWVQFLPVEEWFSAWLLVKSYPGSLKNTMPGSYVQRFWFRWAWVGPGHQYILKTSQVILIHS